MRQIERQLPRAIFPCRGLLLVDIVSHGTEVRLIKPPSAGYSRYNKSRALVTEPPGRSVDRVASQKRPDPLTAEVCSPDMRLVQHLLSRSTEADTSGFQQI